MSLFEKSDGILDTYVHWSEIEERMQNALGTTATFGSNKTVKNIGEGNGLLSRISLIHPDWQNGTDDLPKAFVAKICTPIAFVEFSEKSAMKMDISFMAPAFEKLCTRAHNVEVNTYEMLYKYDIDRKLPLPKIYYSQKFSEENKNKGYMIIEYFDDLVPCHLTDCIDIDAVKMCLRSVAVWEAIGLKMTDEEVNKYSFKSLSENFGEFFKPENAEHLTDGLEEFCGEEHKEKVQEFNKIARKIGNMKYMNYMDNMTTELNMRPVFVHGDLWSTNVLWAKKDGKYKIRGHIDFQTAAFGTPAMDLCRLLFANLSGKDRREHWKELLETFYGYLREEVEGEMPYTFESLLENYKKFIPFGGFFVASLVGPLYDFIKEHRPEVSDNSKEVLLEKVVAVIEDVIEYYPKEKVDSNENIQ